MRELQTYLGVDIPIETRGILYICEVKQNKIYIKKEILFTDTTKLLKAYLKEEKGFTQVMQGNNYNELIKDVHLKHYLVELYNKRKGIW